MKRDSWHCLLALRQMLKHSDCSAAEAAAWLFDFDKNSYFTISDVDPPAAYSLADCVLLGLDADPPDWPAGLRFRLDDGLKVSCLSGSVVLTEEELLLWKRYLPLAVLPLFARQRGRAMTFSHFAQTLDGRIATLSGDSRWIGDEANLEHAHRLRALCDAVLVGHDTLKLDRPRLTVRKVEGPQPLRLVLCSRVPDNFHPEKEMFVLCPEEHAPAAEHFVPFCTDGEGRISVRDVLDWLYERPCYSLLVEGGAGTTSGFLEAGLLDVLQLYVAPMLLGSGRSSFRLPEAESLSGALRFSTYVYEQIGEGVMFTGTPS